MIEHGRDIFVGAAVMTNWFGYEWRGLGSFYFGWIGGHQEWRVNQAADKRAPQWDHLAGFALPQARREADFKGVSKRSNPTWEPKPAQHTGLWYTRESSGTCAG